MSKQPKPAKRRASAGEKVRNWWVDKGCIEHSDMLRDNVDCAIRAAVKETWFACENHESENSESHKAQIKGQIEQRFGVKL